MFVSFLVNSWWFWNRSRHRGSFHSWRTFKPSLLSNGLSCLVSSACVWLSPTEESVEQPFALMRSVSVSVVIVLSASSVLSISTCFTMDSCFFFYSWVLLSVFVSMYSHVWDQLEVQCGSAPLPRWGRWFFHRSTVPIWYRYRHAIPQYHTSP